MPEMGSGQGVQQTPSQIQGHRFGPVELDGDL